MPHALCGWLGCGKDLASVCSPSVLRVQDNGFLFLLSSSHAGFCRLQRSSGHLQTAPELTVDLTSQTYLDAVDNTNIKDDSNVITNIKIKLRCCFFFLGGCQQV